MGFFNDFASGFVSSEMQKQDRRAKVDDSLDLYRKQKLADLDADKKLYDHKSEREAAAKAEAYKREQASRANDFSGALEYAPKAAPEAAPTSPFGAPSAPAPTVQNPEVIAPTAPDEEQKYTSAAAKAAMRGDDSAYKSYKAKADVAGISKKEKDKARTQAREDILSVEGLSPAKDLAKEDADVFKTKGDDMGTYERYFGTPKTINYATPLTENVKDVKDVKAASADAVKLSSLLAKATSDETGKSSKGAGELKDDAVSLVRYKNILNNPALADKHEEATNAIVDTLNGYPEAAASAVKLLKLEEITPAGATSSTPEVPSAKTVVKTLYSPSTKKTKTIYSDGTEEIN